MIDQLTIFDFINREVRTEPVSTLHTRGESHIRIQEAAPIMRERVFGLIAMFGPLTDEQIAELGHLNPSTARPRRLELERAGRIVAAGYSHTKSGRKAVAWKIVE